MSTLKEKFNKCCNWVGSKQDACSSHLARICTCGNYRLVFNAPVTLWFLGTCFVVWALKVSTQSENLANFFRSPARFEVLNMGQYPLTPLRFVTHIFGHGDWKHFVGNTTSLLLVLPLLEEKYKARWLVIITLLNAVVGALANICLKPRTVVLGASGVVFQCMLLAVFSGRYHSPGDIPMTFILGVIIFLVPEIQAWGTDDGISHTAHMVGGLVGALAAFGAQGHARFAEEVHRSQVGMTDRFVAQPPGTVQMTWRA